jgi:hypothetical protein
MENEKNFAKNGWIRHWFREEIRRRKIEKIKSNLIEYLYFRCNKN